MSRKGLSTFLAFALGIFLGAALHAALSSGAATAHAQPPQATPNAPNIEGELKTITGKLPDQSHAMQDVSYHFSNLWFAGQSENWDLAEFYRSETRSHLHWAMRIIPKRKDKAGHEIDLAPILEALENGPLKQLQDAIAAKDKDAFEKTYRFTLEGCYACHKTVEKPFLRPQIPSRPETPIINFDPNADWPK
jgi:hypothetical protein